MFNFIDLVAIFLVLMGLLTVFFIIRSDLFNKFIDILNALLFYPFGIYAIELKLYPCDDNIEDDDSDTHSVHKDDIVEKISDTDELPEIEIDFKVNFKNRYSKKYKKSRKNKLRQTKKIKIIKNQEDQKNRDMDPIKRKYLQKRKSKDLKNALINKYDIY